LRDLAGRDGTVIVALNTDEFVEQFKGKKPIMSLEERMAVVASCRYVDIVVTNTGGADSRPAILETKADFVITGTDWCDRDYMGQMGFTREWLEENNIGFGFLPYSIGVSTTDVRARLASE
jgi:glycerol-3-phosphate cytidylyltransferase-like family protein